jgi:uncharacterized membrane protein
MSDSTFPAPTGGQSRPGGMLSLFKHRPRILICAAVGVVIYLLLPADMRVATRSLLAWNIATALFIALVGWMMARSSLRSIASHASLEDENQWVLLVVGVIAACAAMAAIVAELSVVRDMTGLHKAEHIALTGTTILSAWIFIHLMFALHYAHEYYAPTRTRDDPPETTRAGLRFPADSAPTYGDFAYFSFVIGCACATADVETISRPMRNVALAHGVIAFFFNTIILALTINIGAGLI